MDATSTRPQEVTVESMPNLAEIVAIDTLLSRLDPSPGICRVPGCLHLHDQANTPEDAPALAA
jgi:hypothetical protein